MKYNQYKLEEKLFKKINLTHKIFAKLNLK